MRNPYDNRLLVCWGTASTKFEINCKAKFIIVRVYWLSPVVWINLLIETEWDIYAWINHTNIGSDNGLSSGRHKVIFGTNTGIFLIGTLGKKNFN